MSIKILYFASLKEALNRGEQRIELPEGVTNLGQLREWLSANDPEVKKAFDAMPRLRSAVNMEMADAETPVSDGDEVAFFPPVTGG